MNSQMLENSMAVQASGGGAAAAGMVEKMAEQEKIIEHKTREINQLMVRLVLLDIFVAWDF